MNGDIVVLQSTYCFHSVHRNCLRKSAVRWLSVPKTLGHDADIVVFEDVLCPQCATIIDVKEIRSHLIQEDLQAIETKQCQVLLKRSVPDSVKCSCGASTEFKLKGVSLQEMETLSESDLEIR